MGQPAGGSLTADQWLVTSTVVCPIAVTIYSFDLETLNLYNICFRFLKYGPNIAPEIQKPFDLDELLKYLNLSQTRKQRKLLCVGQRLQLSSEMLPALLR